MSYRKSEGFDLAELRTASDELGNIKPEKARDLGYEVLDGGAWLSQEVDILIPAALEDQITPDNVASVSERVRILAEGANGPTVAGRRDRY